MFEPNSRKMHDTRGHPGVCLFVRCYPINRTSARVFCSPAFVHGYINVTSLHISTYSSIVSTCERKEYCTIDFKMIVKLLHLTRDSTAILLKITYIVGQWPYSL